MTTTPAMLTKANDCANLASKAGLRATIPWMALIQALLSMLMTCIPLAADATDHLNHPDALDSWVMFRQCLRFANDREEARAMVSVLVRQGATTTEEHTTAMFAELKVA